MYALRKQNWDKFFHYRPLTCLVQMCRIMIFTWSQWACSRRQTSLKIQARERWKILPSKLIGEHSSLHFWLRRYTHSVTLLKVSYDFFFFYHNEFFRKLNKSVLDCRKVERTSKASVLFQYIFASSGIWQGTASSQKFTQPYWPWTSIFNKLGSMESRS